jgi:hypothetical protein
VIVRETACTGEDVCGEKGSACPSLVAKTVLEAVERGEDADMFAFLKVEWQRLRAFNE